MAIQEGMESRLASSDVVDSLNGSVILITGGAGGIGTALARKVVEAGGRVLLSDVDLDALDSVDPELAHDSVATTLCDVTSSEQVHRMMDECVRRFGRIDAVVNCAGVIDTQHAGQVDVDTWTEIFTVNVQGPLLVCQAAREVMRNQGAGGKGRVGTLINLTSRSARMARPYSPAYGASKAALESLTLTFASAFANEGICSIAVCPGDIREGMLGKAMPALAVAQRRSVDELAKERIFQAPAEFAAIVIDCLNSQGMTLNGALVGPDRVVEPMARVVVDHA